MENPIWKIQKNLENPMENTINDAYNMENPYGKWMMPMGCQKSIQTTTVLDSEQGELCPKSRPQKRPRSCRCADGPVPSNVPPGNLHETTGAFFMGKFGNQKGNICRK